MSATIDHRSNVIPEVVIGAQTWMSQNYDFAGDPPDGDYANVTVYGKLYTWTEAIAIGSSVDGWHLPSPTEWGTLITYLGGSSVAGGHLKETGTTHWDSPNTGADNSSGFTAVPSGQRDDDEGYAYVLFGASAIWWTNNDAGAGAATYYYATSASAATGSGSILKDNKFAVRLIKD